MVLYLPKPTQRFLFLEPGLKTKHPYTYRNTIKIKVTSVSVVDTLDFWNSKPIIMNVCHQNKKKDIKYRNLLTYYSAWQIISSRPITGCSKMVENVTNDLIGQ